MSRRRRLRLRLRLWQASPMHRPTSGRVGSAAESATLVECTRPPLPCDSLNGQVDVARFPATQRRKQQVQHQQPVNPSATTAVHLLQILRIFQTVAREYCFHHWHVLNIPTIENWSSTNEAAWEAPAIPQTPDGPTSISAQSNHCTVAMRPVRNAIQNERSQPREAENISKQRFTQIPQI